MNSRALVARKERGLTQEQLAEQLRLNHADIARIEKHDWIPPAEVRKRYAEALGVAEEHLFGLIAGEPQGRP